MKTPEEQDDLWQLLGKARKPAASPYFARNVLREIRSSKQVKSGLLFWLQSHLRTVSLAGVAAILLAVNISRVCVPHSAAPAVPVEPAELAAANTIKPDDSEVITHLDELVAYEENSVWLEDSSK